MTLTPMASGTAEMLHALVPVAEPLPPRLFVQVTCVTAASSDAVPLRARLALVVDQTMPVVGEVRVRRGGLLVVTMRLSIAKELAVALAMAMPSSLKLLVRRGAVFVPMLVVP